MGCNRVAQNLPKLENEISPPATPFHQNISPANGLNPRPRRTIVLLPRLRDQGGWTAFLPTPTMPLALQTAHLTRLVLLYTHPFPKPNESPPPPAKTVQPYSLSRKLGFNKHALWHHRARVLTRCLLYNPYSPFQPCPITHQPGRVGREKVRKRQLATNVPYI